MIIFLLILVISCWSSCVVLLLDVKDGVTKLISSIERLICIILKAVEEEDDDAEDGNCEDLIMGVVTEATIDDDDDDVTWSDVWELYFRC